METPTTGKRLPFSVSRNLALNLSDQVADGLRQAIASGCFRTGDMLPKFEDMARELGVSMRIPREAVAKLAAEGLVSPRQRIGCFVLGRNEGFWRGQILSIVSDRSEGSFFSSTLLGEMRRLFADAGYLFTTVTVTRRKGGGCDMPYLDMVLRQKFDFIFPLHCPAILYRHLDAIRAPWTTLQMPEGETFIGDLAPFVAQCHHNEVRRILLVGYGSLDQYRAVEARLRDAGFDVERHRSHAKETPGYLEDIERGTMHYFMRRFSHPRETWPDLVLWLDDFLAFGGLTALLELGVRIPGDVYAVTLSNKGFGPVYPRTLARFEFDPIATARAAVAEILGRIAGKPAAPICSAVAYVGGESLPS